MPTAQLNVRIDEDLKLRGDQVLAREGLSAAQTIKSLWTFLSERQKVPAELCGRPSSRRTDEADALGTALEPGLAVRLAHEAGIDLKFEAASADALVDAVYDDKARRI